MCEFCSGLHVESKAGVWDANGSGARLALSEQAGDLLLDSGKVGISGGSRKAEAVGTRLDTAGQPEVNLTPGRETTSSADASTPNAGPESSDEKSDPLKRFGVNVRIVDNQQEVFFKADNADHVVLRAPLTATAEQLSTRVDNFVSRRVNEIEGKYNVQFAQPGETVEQQWLEDSTTCKRSRGDMIHATKPTLPLLYGLEEGLKRSSPSQYALDGKTGAKIYLLDRKYMPDIYGGKQVLGVYRQEDKDKRPALYLTPAGMDLPPTDKDASAAGRDSTRNIAWVTSHEATHNSQRNNWPTQFAPQEIKDQLGWKTIELIHEGKKLIEWNQLKGKNGELFMHGTDDCHSPSTWYLTDADGNRLDAKGNKVDKIADAQHFTNDEVIARAQVKPFTYYFMNPTEMLSEGLTAYRSGSETRARLAQESPELYKAAAKYDQEEIDKFYGLTWYKTSTHVRNPDGEVVPNTFANQTAIREFERSTARRSGRKQ
jgi:hypothetical protein